MTIPNDAEPPAAERVAFERVFVSGATALPLDDRLNIVRALRRHSAPAGERMDRALLGEVDRLRQGLEEARGLQQQLSAVVSRLTAMPWHAAILLAHADRDVASAVVLYLGSRRVVAFAHDLEPSDFAPGDEVLLGPELNVILGRSPQGPRAGAIATFDRLTPDGRLVLRHRDQDVLATAAGRLAVDRLAGGDLVCWDERAGVAFETIARADGEDRFLEETPQETFAMIGGLDAEIERLQRSIRLHLHHPDVVRDYGVRRKGSVLLVGPPGTGKTLLAKALANWLGGISRGGQSRFINVKPAALHEMWYGRTEQNYREAFRAAREAAARQPEVPVVMFFDEVDAIGASRGASLTRVDDRVLNAFMTELDGLETRGNVLVVAATNRRDSLDPALLRPGRLGDLELEVPRPALRAAREILAKYLPLRLTYRAAGDRMAPRDAVLDAAVSALYAPNAATELVVLTLRDGKQRLVRAAELMSGASLAKIAADACERAGLRVIDGGEPGIGPDDLRAAAADELDRLAASLTPASCRQHLPDLPRDLDVVRVEPRRRLGRTHRYLSVA